MKTPKEWQSLLNSVNFPNFNKSGRKEVLDFVFTDCIQRDALLTWIVIQLGADFKANVILDHKAVIEYLKQRKVIDECIVEGFVNATISSEEQEKAWDKIFNFTKMQRRLMPQLYDELPRSMPTSSGDTNYSETFLNLSKSGVEEPLFKELEILKKLRRIKPSDMEETLQNSGDYQQSSGADTVEENAEDLEISYNEETNPKENDQHTNGDDVGSEQKILTTTETAFGTWYSTSDGLQKIFVPLGAPPLGALDLNLKKVKIVCEDSSIPEKKTDVKTAERLESFFSRLLQH